MSPREPTPPWSKFMDSRFVPPRIFQCQRSIVFPCVLGTTRMYEFGNGRVGVSTLSYSLVAVMKLKHYHPHFLPQATPVHRMGRKPDAGIRW